MAKFTVTNTTILHNQKTYGVGDTIELTDEKQIAKLASYIAPVADSTTDTNPSEQSTVPPTNAGTDSTTTTTATKTSKASKKSDKSTNASDVSDTLTTATDTTPNADTNAASSNADSVSVENAV